MNILTSYGHIAIKQNSSSIILNRNIFLFIRQFLNPPVISGIIAVMIAPLFYFSALKTLDLNVAYSFTALNQIIIPVYSMLILKERINPKKIAAILLIASGLIIWNL